MFELENKGHWEESYSVLSTIMYSIIYKKMYGCVD